MGYKSFQQINVGDDQTPQYHRFWKNFGQFFLSGASYFQLCVSSRWNYVVSLSFLASFTSINSTFGMRRQFISESFKFCAILFCWEGITQRLYEWLKCKKLPFKKFLALKYKVLWSAVQHVPHHLRQVSTQYMIHYRRYDMGTRNFNQLDT